MQCTRPGCGFVFPITHPKDKLRCPSCRFWNLPKDTEDDEETILLSDARLSTTERIPVGMLDEVFGNGGLARTSVNLVAGPPGAGKTRLFLDLCDIIINIYNIECLYIANEQTPDEILETAKQIHIQNIAKIRIVKAMGGLRSSLGDLVRRFRPCVIIIDSLTKLVGEDIILAVKIVEHLKELTVEFKAPSLVVNQITKDGDHAGLMKLQHAGDATFMLEKDDEDGSRFFYSTKNRFGEAPKGIELLMTPEDSETPGKLIKKEEKQQ